MDGDRKRDGIDTIAKFYRQAAIIRNFSGLRILLHLIRIRIQHFRLNTDPDPGVFDDQKKEKIFSCKKINFVYQKLQFTVPIPRPL
jgi:hypothetical protein